MLIWGRTPTNSNYKPSHLKCNLYQLINSHFIIQIKLKYLNFMMYDILMNKIQFLSSWNTMLEVLALLSLARFFSQFYNLKLFIQQRETNYIPKMGLIWAR